MKLTNEDLDLIINIMKSAIEDNVTPLETSIARLCIVCYKAGMHKGAGINKEQLVG